MIWAILCDAGESYSELIVIAYHYDTKCLFLTKKSIMCITRSGEGVSAQIGKMGTITGLQDGNFQLGDGQCFNIKNDGDSAVTLEVQLAGMEDGDFSETHIETGWNPEIVKAVKQSSLSSLNLKWGY